MPYKISIIVPHYKTELYIYKCIDSILAQTLEEFELILVDDGSPDKCGEICDEYAKKDNRIKVIHKENGGYSSAINAGLDIARGEYIGIVDGDDYIEKDMYEVLYNLAKKYDADVSECNYYFVENENIIVAHNSEGIHVRNNLDSLYRLIKTGWTNALWNKIYRRELFSQLRLPYGKKYSDAFITYKIFASAQRLVYTGECKYFYVQREGSVMTNRDYSTDWSENLEFVEERFYYLKKKINDKSFIKFAQSYYCYIILFHYRMLCSNRSLDPDKKYREMLRDKIITNYHEFRTNSLLKRYNILLSIFKLNGKLGTLLVCFYNFYKDFYMWINNKKCSMFGKSI